MSNLNVLLVSKNYKDYIAKVWWSIQKGLSNTCNLYTFGEGQQYYQSVKTYQDILNIIPAKIDAIIIDDNFNNNLWNSLDSISCKKVALIGDYWSLPQIFYTNIIPKVDYVFSFFYEFTERDSKIKFMPPSIDPDMFKDWKEDKKYSLGFLGAGCSSYDSNYPSRSRITKLLKLRYKDFYSPSHPGWGYFNDSGSLVGVNFSKAINRCKMIVNTSGIIKHCNPKYIEFPASGSMLLAGDCKHLDKIHFKDGVNCVQFKSDEELIEKIDYYMLHDNERNSILSDGLKTVEQYHTSEVRAREMLKILE